MKINPIIGLEIGQRFKIKGMAGYEYYFTDNCGCVRDYPGGSEVGNHEHILGGIINGTFEIQKAPNLTDKMIMGYWSSKGFKWFAKDFGIDRVCAFKNAPVRNEGGKEWIPDFEKDDVSVVNIGVDLTSINITWDTEPYYFDFEKECSDWK